MQGSEEAAAVNTLPTVQSIDCEVCSYQCLPFTGASHAMTASTTRALGMPHSLLVFIPAAVPQCMDFMKIVLLCILQC